MNILDFQNKKTNRIKISMVTCYDYWSAAIINESPIDAVLVGDSASMVMHGFPTTVHATTEMMAWHTSAVVKGAPQKFIVADMPFLSFRKSLDENMKAAEKLMQAGAHALKLEGAKGNLELVQHLVESGIPVMGHMGLTPQSIHQLGGFKVQGRRPKEHDEILHESKKLQEAGCFSLVLECVPASLAKEISESLTIPTIGIGAGDSTDGQILVLWDMLGMNDQFSPKFLRKYLDGRKQILHALSEYHEDVVTKQFPAEEESYL